MCFKRKRKLQWCKIPAGYVPAGGIEPNRERPRSGEMVLSKQQAAAMNINRIFDAFESREVMINPDELKAAINAVVGMKSEPDAKSDANPAPRVCKQCGAPLTGDKCEYCGTYYK